MKLNWGHGITAVYATFAIVTMSFVVFAVGRPADLVSENYYADSLSHDQRQQAAERAKAAGGMTIVTRGGEVVVTLPGSHAKDAISGHARLYRASSAREDRVWAIEVDQDGRQALPIDGLPSGRWLLQVNWSRNGLDYYAESPLVLP